MELGRDELGCAEIAKMMTYGKTALGASSPREQGSAREIHRTTAGKSIYQQLEREVRWVIGEERETTYSQPCTCRSRYQEPASR